MKERRKWLQKEKKKSGRIRRKLRRRRRRRRGGGGGRRRRRGTQAFSMTLKPRECKFSRGVRKNVMQRCGEKVWREECCSGGKNVMC